MRIGCPKEIKNHEYRVGLTPESAAELIAHGHEVVIETGAGAGIGASDVEYTGAGATLGTVEDVFACDIVVKVKEPQAEERKRLRPGQVLYTYLHLAPDAPQTRDLLDSGATCIAYETVTSASGGLPLLKPMSQVAGRMSVQAGAHVMEKAQGGRGVLLGGVPGVAPGKVVIIGGGVVGRNAAAMAVGLGAEVVLLDRSNDVLEGIDAQFGGRVKTQYSTRTALETVLATADLVIGAVLIPGAAAPKLVTREMLGTMQKGAVVVDVAIDQGGCFESSRATTHADPTYVEEDVVHYCVANMPGGVARTSTYALNNATLPHLLRIADKGVRAALQADPHLMAGLNVAAGRITCAPVAEAQGLEFLAADKALDLV
ncbi:alanine dehydrogenase [Pseudooceanicola sediminis]|uniref:Alanine dehydrogenase n=1 Tax=Pseudooceanicola sediminis TaxID=2211117 RepID=A0A399IZG2_9RHOB|nr:alanine dehydrogenase [Pseudooceanicola sediminis]KAA2312931.1 alanine dehydrogenase [Puniceibacterium sp. HSS470]RII37669.1 alanine dehydrogenase [Pseudooceanicola sediminis]|tara:strand:- start:12307 stop:13422 length:1116 start_codon:yes stop_codon:yes gene_type:complete